jgi:head-to-tail connecting protein
MASLAVDAKARLATLRRRKDPWLSLWQELAEIYLPGRAHFTSARHEGERDNEAVFDGTPRLAARGLAAAVDGLIKPKTSNWFEPTVEDEDLSEQPNVKSWLEMVREKMWQVIYHKDSRFIQRSSEVDDALVVHGWGTLWIGENRARNGILFRAFHNKDVSIDENADGMVDTVAVEEWLSPRQAIARFGEEKVHKDIRDAAGKETAANDFQFAQIVVPQSDRLADRIGPASMAFKSIVLDVKHEQVMNEGGFHEFPAAIPRWDTEPGQVYPRSPGMIALPDALTLQAIGKTLLVGGERAADPPIFVPSDSMISPIRTFPGGVSVYDMQALSDGGIQNPFFPMPTSSQLPVGREMQGDYRFQVSRAFFADVLNLPIEGIRTATEVLERKEEFIRVLGPIFGRLETDYIGATAERVFAIMERAGAFPERPDELADIKIGFRFQSPLQQARKALDVAGLNRTLEVTAPLIDLMPELMDNLDGDKVFRDSPQWSGIPSEWLRPEDEVEDIRAGRADAEDEMASIEAAKPIADSLKSVAQAQEIAGNAPVPQGF